MQEPNEITDPSQDLSDEENTDDELPQIQENEADEVIVLEQNTSSSAHTDDARADVENAQDFEMGANDPSESNSQPITDDAIIVLNEHKSEVLAVAASPSDKHYIITGGMDDIGIIWDLETRTALAKVDGSNESVSTVAFSHDGKYSAFGSENGAISVVFMDGSPAPGKPLDGPGDIIHFLNWHPRGPVLLAGSEDNVAYMWNAAKSSFMMAFVGHEGAVLCGTFSADGKQVITGSKDCSIRVWNPSTGETLVRIQTGIDGLRSVFHKAHILCVAGGMANSPAEKLIASGCDEGDVFVTHRETGQVVSQLPRHTGGVECVAFCPHDTRSMLLASAGGDGVIRVWDLERSSERCKFTHGGVIPKVLWHPTLPVLVSCSSDASIIVWNILTGTEIVRLTGHSDFISDFCFAAGNEFIASTSGDGSTRIFDVRLALSQLQ